MVSKKPVGTGFGSDYKDWQRRQREAAERKRQKKAERRQKYDARRADQKRRSDEASQRWQERKARQAEGKRPWDKGRGGSPHAYGGLAAGGSNLAGLKNQAFSSPAQREAAGLPPAGPGGAAGGGAISDQPGGGRTTHPNAYGGGAAGAAGAAGPPGQAGAAGPLGSRTPVGRLRARWPEHDFNPEAMAEAHRLGEEAKGGFFRQMFSAPGAAEQRATEAVEKYLSGQNPDFSLPEGVDPWSTMPGGSRALPGVRSHFGTFAPPPPRPPNPPTIPTPGGGEATLGGTPDFPVYTPSGPGSIPHRAGMNRIQGVFPSVETGPPGPHSRMDVTDPEILGAGPEVYPDINSDRTIEPTPTGQFFPEAPAPTPPMAPWEPHRSGMPPTTPPVGVPGPMGDPGFPGPPDINAPNMGVSTGSNPALNTLAVNGGAMPARQKPLRAGSRFGMV